MKRSAYAKTALLFTMLLGAAAFQSEGGGAFGCSTGPLGGDPKPDGGTDPRTAVDGGAGPRDEGRGRGGPPDGGPGKGGDPRDGGPGKMDPPPEGAPGPNLASCTCKDGRSFQGCIAADCSSAPEREQKCAEVCGEHGGLVSTACQPRADRCAAPPPPPPPPPPEPGPNFASCTCKDGKVLEACVALDCSVAADRERRCAEACGGNGGLASSSCQLRADRCASPPPPPPPPPEQRSNFAKCACKDGKSFDGCVAFDCSVAADRERMCTAMCGADGGYASSSCELKACMCVGR